MSAPFAFGKLAVMSRKEIKSKMARMTPYAAVLCLVLGFVPFGVSAQTDPASFAQALALGKKGDWDAALAASPQGVARDVIQWQRLRAGVGLLGEYEDFLKRRSDWPGLPYLKTKGEAAVARSTTPERVIAYFGSDSPNTAEGVVALVAALQAKGDAARAEEVAMAGWSSIAFPEDLAQRLRDLAPNALELVDDHRADRLLWEGRWKEVQSLLPLLSPEMRALAQARIALQSGTDGVNAMIAAVPKALANDSGLAHDRFAWRMKRDRYDDSLDLILERSGSSSSLGNPQVWADRRALLVRKLIREGKGKEAYRLASSHQLTQGSDYADLEFLAGFSALRLLKQPEVALKHFQHLEGGVSTPISTSRALYWQGRAHEAAGDKAAARQDYERAAVHQTAYYGLLASERIGKVLDKALLKGGGGGDWQSAAWTKSSVHEAAKALLASGDLTLAKRFWLHLGESLDAKGMAQLGRMALDIGEPHVAVLVGKAAAERGLILTDAYFPVPDIVPDGLSVSRAFALAISRRESEFDPAARSHADARGLMQLLPGTAKMMAKKIGKDFDAGKLLTDPAYNASLGTAYLAQLVEEFGPSIALVASGYNAGPGRPRRWIDELGDPRRPDVDIVDWVEAIPFTETRTYVMRVVEGVVIYRAKLKGVAGDIHISQELKG